MIHAGITMQTQHGFEWNDFSQKKLSAKFSQLIFNELGKKTNKFYDGSQDTHAQTGNIFAVATRVDIQLKRERMHLRK